MRDDLWFGGWTPVTVKRRWSSSQPWHNYSKVYWKNHITRTYRDESSSTSRSVSGSYQSPTSYRAFFALSSGSALNYEYTWKGHTPTVQYKLTAPSACSDYPIPGANAWGSKGPYPRVPDVPYSVVSSAEKGVYDLIKNNDLNMAQTAGEMRESVATLIGLMRFAVDTVKYVRGPKGTRYGSKSDYAKSRKGNTNGGKGVTFTKPRKPWREGTSVTEKAAATSNLVNYGLVPIMNDMYATMGILKDGLEAARGTVQVNRLDDSFKLPALGTSFKGSVTGSVKRGCEASITIKVTNPQLFELHRYGLTDPLALAWELLPLSFVVDWFTGVGSFIESLSRPLGVAIEHGYRTTYVVNNFDIEWVLEWHNIYSGNMPKVTHNFVNMQRQTYWNWPIVMPYLDVGIDPSNYRNLLAVLVSRMS